MGKPILVVGGAGYIGSTTAYRLADAGYEVHLLDSLVTGFRELAGAGPLHIVDLADKAALMSIFEANPYEAVLHFAAYIAVGESVREPLKYYENNVAGTLNLLDAMRTHHVKRLVFSSTAAVYGEPQEVPIPETHPLAPINPYGWSKRMMEQVFADCRNAWGLETVALRYFNAAGAEAAGRTGEWHRPETHLVPVALRAALENGTPMQVFGSDYPTRDGTCVRDYIHVSDLAAAHQLALEHLLDGGTSEVFNLGSEAGFTVLEILAAIKEITGLAVPYTLAPRRPGDPASLVASSAKIRSQLGWVRHFSSPAQIVKDAHAWHARMGFCGGGHVPYVSLPEATSSRLRSKHNPSA